MRAVTSVINLDQAKPVSAGLRPKVSVSLRPDCLIANHWVDRHCKDEFLIYHYQFLSFLVISIFFILNILYSQLIKLYYSIITSTEDRKINIPSNKSKIVSILGGNGFIGRNLVRELAKDGYRIKIGTRNPATANHMFLVCCRTDRGF